MIELPDWKRPELYPPLPENFVAWEFLRRNQGYQRDFQAMLAEAEEWNQANPDFQHFELECNWNHPGGALLRKRYAFELGNPARYDELLAHFRDKWGVCWFADPSLEDTEEFELTAHDRPELYKPVELAYPVLEGPLVMIPVDLSMPLEALEKHVMGMINRLRKKGVEDGVFTLKTGRVQAPRLYSEYLRMLDAMESGATIREIGDILHPLATNHPEERQRDKRLRAAIGQGQSRCSGAARMARPPDRQRPRNGRTIGSV